MTRERLVEILGQKNIEKVIITHGTDTMIKTAGYIAQRVGQTRMKIVITGAFLPESFKDSDADFNIGVAMGNILNSIWYKRQCSLKDISGGIGTLSPGVYVAMNGQVSKVGTYLVHRVV